ncbi:hypothetical protein [Streptomyces mirabilis]|uniref:hypothetical protein n=1 Tax=Streptomyces mirabilis TaxID=68239 RepID=UPI0033AB90D3
MRAFNFKQGKEPWDSGTLLHWYVEVDWDDPRHDTLAQLVTDSNQAVLDAGFPVAPIEHRWLHITVDQISRPAHLIDQAERDKLVAEVTHRVATIAPFTIVIGSVLSYARRHRRHPSRSPARGPAHRSPRRHPHHARR